MTAAHYRVRHETEYAYAADVSHAHHLLHLTPRIHPLQTCDAHSLKIDPLPAHRCDAEDAFGNPVVRLEFDQPHSRLLVTADLGVTVQSASSQDFGPPLSWNEVCNLLAYSSRARSAEELEASQFRTESPHVRLKRSILEYSRECFPRNAPLVACVEALLSKLHREFKYAPRETHVGTSVTELLGTRRGVCQDFAHLMIACLRVHGLAARYVSGYLRTIPAPGQPKLLGADASHAWVSVYVPPLGWLDLDPTNGVRVGTDHITLAWGRDFGDVSPLRGVIVGGASHRVTVRVTVTEEVTASQSPPRV